MKLPTGHGWCNPRVGGSNPPPGTTTLFLEIAFKVTDMLSIENPNADYLQAYLDGFEISIEAN